MDRMFAAADENSSHPRPPVAVALRSVFVLGVACTAFGLFFFVTFGLLNPLQRFRPYLAAMGLVLWLLPGMSYLWCVYLMRRQRRGAATAALATAAVQTVLAGALLVASATFDPVTPLPIVFCVLWLVALADCMRHLIRARRFIASATERAHGFDVGPPAPKPVLPVEEVTS